MKFLSLFAGIGGIDLGLERAGHECIGQVEWDEWCQSILKKHWPHTPRHGDVTTFEGTEFGPYDLLAAGYPCQPFSRAGNRDGEDDPRHLWPHVARIIRLVRPRLVLLENVPDHLSLGFDTVLGDLAALGYDAEWALIPAAAVGTPHLRYRLFVIAYPEGQHGNDGPVYFKHRPRPIPEPGNGHLEAGGVDRHWWSDKPPVARVVHGVPRPVDEGRGLGNAVVPQVAEYIGRLIAEPRQDSLSEAE